MDEGTCYALGILNLIPGSDSTKLPFDLRVSIYVYTLHIQRKKEKCHCRSYYARLHVNKNARDRTVEGETKHKQQDKTKKPKSPLHISHMRRAAHLRR